MPRHDPTINVPLTEDERILIRFVLSDIDPNRYSQDELDQIDQIKTRLKHTLSSLSKESV